MIIHIRGVNLQIRKMKTIVSTSISPVNMKYSEACSLNITTTTTIIMIWQKCCGVVRSEATFTTKDLKEAGDWL